MVQSGLHVPAAQSVRQQRAAAGVACGGGGNHKIAGSVVAPPTTARRLPRCAAPQTHPNFAVLCPGGALASGGTCGLLRTPLLPTGGVHMLWSGLALRGPPMVLRELHSASCSSACVLSPPRVQARQVVHTRCVNLKYIPRSQGAYAVGFSGNMAVLCASRIERFFAIDIDRSS